MHVLQYVKNALSSLPPIKHYNIHGYPFLNDSAWFNICLQVSLLEYRNRLKSKQDSRESREELPKERKFSRSSSITSPSPGPSSGCTTPVVVSGTPKEPSRDMFAPLMPYFGTLGSSLAKEAPKSEFLCPECKMKQIRYIIIRPSIRKG